MNSKQFLFLLVAILTSLQLNAQIEKGTKRIGPDLSLRSQFQAIDPGNSANSTSFEFGLSGGYFFLTNLEIGLATDLQITNSSFAGVTNSSSFAITFGPGLTYMTPLQENLYLPLSVSYGFSRLTSSTNGGDDSFGGREFRLGAGLEYIIQNKLGVRFMLNYETVRITDTASTNTANISLNRLNGDVGFNIYF